MYVYVVVGEAPQDNCIDIHGEVAAPYYFIYGIYEDHETAKEVARLKNEQEEKDSEKYNTDITYYSVSIHELK